MGGINGVSTGGSLTAYQGVSLDSGSSGSAPTPKTGTGGLGDTNQAKTGRQVLQNAAGAPADGSLKVYSGVDLSFQDHTPQNPGSSVRPMGGSIEVYSVHNDLGAGASATGAGRAATGDGTIAAYSVSDDLSKGRANQGSGGVFEPLKNFVSKAVRLNIGSDRKFGSVGDPHETTGSGLHFDNQLTGRFVAFRSDEGDLEVQKDQGPDRSGRWPGATLNHAVAMKVGDNTISYNVMTNQLLVNGRPAPFRDGQSVLPDGTSLAIAGNKLSVTSPRGDVINVVRADAYLDLSGTISGFRPTDSVEGSLGDFHAGDDQAKDLVTRDGQTVGTGQIKGFLDSWRVRPGESLFA